MNETKEMLETIESVRWDVKRAKDELLSDPESTWVYLDHALSKLATLKEYASKAEE